MAKVDVLIQPVHRALYSLSLPMVFGIIAVMSINLVDAYFVGQLGTLPLAAISFTFPVVFTLGSFAIGLGAGTSSVVSRAYGSGAMERVRQLATHSLVLAFLLVSAASILGLLTIDLQFQALGADEKTLPLIKKYMQIWYFGLPLLVIPMVANAILRAGGDTRLPSLIMVMAAIMNIVLDPIFINGGWGVPAYGMQGAAIASVIARFFTLLLSVGFLIFKEKLLTLMNISPASVWQSWRQILRVGLPAAFGNMLNPLSIGVLTKIISGYGAVAVAGYGVSTRVEAFLCIPLLALSAAMSPFAGQNYGAGKKQRLFLAFHGTFAFSLLWSLLIGGLCWLFAESFAGLFSQEPEVVLFAARYLRWVSFSAIGYGLLVVFASGFNAIGLSEIGLLLYGLRNFVILIPCTYLFARVWGEAGIAIGIMTANFIAALCLYLFSFWLLRRKLSA